MPTAKDKTILDPQTQSNIDTWLNDNYDETTKATIRKDLSENPQLLEDAFYSRIAFGTAGMRGLMGIGTNRMNDYTVRAASQGLANYINKQPKKEGGHWVLIDYDSRHQSHEFALETAKVLAANGIGVYLFKEMRPIALVSFGCRFKHCTAAIMITASHNPSQYNGYKVWWSDGGQVLPPHDQGIIDEVNKITAISMVKTLPSLQSPLIKEVGPEIDTAYLEAIRPLQNYPSENKTDGQKLKVVYTSLHGTGITIVPRTLREWGFTNLTIVQEQANFDGDFPTVKSPNPEYPETLKMGIDVLIKTNSDILLATDPDADRIGFGININQEVVLFTGNQIACLLLNHICTALSDQNKLPENAAFVKSIVTTELFKAIVKSYNKECFETLIGFKYIAEKIHEWELDPHGKEFIFGAEESYGFLRGTHCRDKDAVVCSALLCEAALHAKLQGKNLLDVLNEIYAKYGIYREKLLSLSFPETKEGHETMSRAVLRLRNIPQVSLNGIPVKYVDDYLNGTRTVIATAETQVLDLPKADVLVYWLEDESKVMIRPSGTEPKIKLYCDIVEKNMEPSQLALSKADMRAEQLLQSMQERLKL